MHREVAVRENKDETDAGEMDKDGREKRRMERKSRARQKQMQGTKKVWNLFFNEIN